MDKTKLQININNEYWINENFVCGWSWLKKCNFVCRDECDHINEFKDLGEIFDTNEFGVAWMEFITCVIFCIVELDDAWDYIHELNSLHEIN
jgi:hypothetical protein